MTTEPPVTYVESELRRRRRYLLVPAVILCVLQLVWIILFQTGNGRGSSIEVQFILPVLFVVAVVLHFRAR